MKAAKRALRGPVGVEEEESKRPEENVVGLWANAVKGQTVSIRYAARERTRRTDLGCKKIIRWGTQLRGKVRGQSFGATFTAASLRHVPFLIQLNFSNFPRPSLLFILSISHSFRRSFAGFSARTGLIVSCAARI